MYICTTDTGKIVIAFVVMRVFQEKDSPDQEEEKSLTGTESTDFLR